MPNEDKLSEHSTQAHTLYSQLAEGCLVPTSGKTVPKKTEVNAHLDVTHFASLTKEEEMAIENEANKIILEGHPIEKYFMDKAEA